jgi:uncharacterized protein YegP (UPF0339 family)
MATPSAYRFRFHQDGEGHWWWHLLSSNSKIVATSAEGYKRKGVCERQAEKIAHSARGGRLILTLPVK